VRWPSARTTADGNDLVLADGHQVNLDGVYLPMMGIFRCRYHNVRRPSTRTRRWRREGREGDDLESPMEVPDSSVGDHEVDLDGVCMPMLDISRCRYTTVRRPSARTIRLLSARTSGVSYGGS